MLTTYLTVALVAYLLCSIPFGYILVKLFLKQDIRQTGSGNIGATNVARSGAKGLAIATLLLDAGKGFAAVFMAAAIAPYYRGHGSHAENYLPLALAALFAIIGHCFPIWLRFKGGKGVATGLGAFAALAPLSVLVALAVFLITLALTRYVSLGSILAALVFPLSSAYLYPAMWDLRVFMITVAAS